MKSRTVRSLKVVLCLWLAGVFLVSGLAPAAAQEMVDTSRYKKEPPYTIGYDIYWLGNEWSALFAKEFERAVKEHQDVIGRVIYTSSDNDIGKQIANIEDMIARNVDIIIVTPISATGLTGVLQKAYARGIPVVLNAALAEGGRYTAYVNTDERAIGGAVAQWIVDELGGQGKVVALSGIAGISVAEERWEGAKAVFDRYPGIQVLAREYADWSTPKAKQVMTNLLAAYPEIDAIWSTGGQMSRGAIQAYEAAGRPLDGLIIGGDDHNGFLKQWVQYRDQIKAISYSKPPWISEVALEVALDILAGKPVPREVVVDSPVITMDRVDDYVRWDLPDTFVTETRLDDETIREIFRQ